MLSYEIRQSGRALARVPGLTAIAVLTVALGVGMGTAFFSVVKAVLLNPLPYTDPDRLAWLAETNDGGRPMHVAFRNFLDWRVQNRTFATMAAYEERPVIIAGIDAATQLWRGGHRRILPRSRDRRGARPNVLAGRAGNRRPAGSGAGVWSLAARLRRILRRDRTHHSPHRDRCHRDRGHASRFQLPGKGRVLDALTGFGDAGLNARTAHNWRVIGRLKPGVPMERAQADVGTIERRIKQQYPSPFQGKDASVISLQSQIVGDVRRPLLMLFGAVGFVLLIVCVNVANLLLVRVTARARELALRTALGASRLHLLRQMLGESLLLAAAGGVCPPCQYS